MKNVLYIGNQLSQSHKTATTIDTLSADLRNEGYTVFTTSKKQNKVLRLMDMLFHIVKYKSSVDLVLIDTYSTTNFYYAYACSQLCRFFKLKYVPILHGGNLPERLKTSPKKSHQIFYNAHINLAPSLYLKHHFSKAGYKNLVFIPNTIPLDRYKFQKRKIDKVKMLWVRSFSKLYNPLLAVRLLKLLKDEGVQASLCMVGPDNDGSMKEAKVLAKELEVDIEFTGKLSKSEWHAKASDFNVFINTTNIDNMPVSVIEAMALGLPIVSTNVGGLPYLLEDKEDAILVEPNDANLFKDAILDLRKNPGEVDKMTSKARQKVGQFDWKVVKQRWFSVLS
ncbi:glycosyltransferase family 4 protein [Hyunsoonleella rubra]|uniref:Glycosyltransferase family 4 protein n=1 Tax=Hyunsoonleella rubra TaxID=1737062 RepID=A0ABW5TFV0_9FLAO